VYRGKKVGVVIPAYNEEELIVETLGGMPDFVDYMFVVNDGSTDKTRERIEARQTFDPRIVLINNTPNQGLGQSLINGYLASLESDADYIAVMAGDNQMHPDDLPGVLDPLVEDQCDYVKGNRLLHQAVHTMPTYRFLGNAVLTILTKFATGYYFIMDPQCGYTAITHNALSRIPIHEMTTGYGYNADILTMLHIQGFRVQDVEVRPVYDREKSKIKLWKYIPKTSYILIRLFFKRLWRRYIIKDFHPLVLFFLFAFFNIIFIIVPLSIRFFERYIRNGVVPNTTMIILVFTILITFQSILFAIWMDMEYTNRHR